MSNLLLSIGFLVGARLISKLTKTTLHTYTKVSNYLMPLVEMYCYYESTNRMAQFALEASTYNNGITYLESLAKYALSTFSSWYGASYSLSLITFIVGYPVVNILFSMAYRYVDGYAKSASSLPVVRALLDTKEHLTKNDNWDIVLYDISFRTWSKSIPIANEKELEEKLPLRCKGADNESELKFGDNCSVCMEEIETKKLHRELRCKHVFHPECVDKWLLERNATCPLCREKAY
jgi:hypothetical protein